MMESILSKFDKSNKAPSSSRQHDAAPPPKRPSPPDPKPKIVWDQSIPCTLPAGRRSRAERRVDLLVSFLSYLLDLHLIQIPPQNQIRLSISTRIQRKSKKDPIPPLPPAEIRMPTAEQFHIHWLQSPKSMFNRAATSIIEQDVRTKWTGQLTPEEEAELPLMIAQHIKYLSSCYKEQEKADAEALRQKRYKRASSNSRMQTVSLGYPLVARFSFYVLALSQSSTHHRPISNCTGKTPPVDCTSWIGWYEL